MFHRLSASRWCSTSSGKPRHSVRGIIVHRKHLYVADEAGDDSEGVPNGAVVRAMAHITGRELEAPVHLVLHGKKHLHRRLGTGSILVPDLTSFSASP